MPHLINLKVTHGMTALELFCAINSLPPEVRELSYLHVKCIRQSARVEFLVNPSEFKGSKFYPSTLAFGELSDDVLSRKAYEYREHGMQSILVNPSTTEELKGIPCRKLSDLHNYLAAMTLISASNTQLAVYETNQTSSPLMFQDKDTLVFAVNMFYTIAYAPEDLDKVNS